MKILEKIALVLYSFIILILSTVLSLVILRLIEITTIQQILNQLINAEIPSIVALIISIIFILLSIKCIFFTNRNNKADKERQGILLQNENGKLMISKETIDNLTSTVVKGFESIEEITTRTIIDKENQLIIMVNLVVGQNVIIKELSANLQNKIKEAIKNTLDLDVKEVNIKIKSYVVKAENNEQ